MMNYLHISFLFMICKRFHIVIIATLRKMSIFLRYWNIKMDCDAKLFASYRSPSILLGASTPFPTHAVSCTISSGLIFRSLRTVPSVSSSISTSTVRRLSSSPLLLIVVSRGLQT